MICILLTFEEGFIDEMSDIRIFLHFSSRPTETIEMMLLLTKYKYLKNSNYYVPSLA